jgi:hypothetical protein
MGVAPKAYPVLFAKLERAKEHIVNLQETWRRFADGHGYPVEADDDPKTGYRTYKIGAVAPIPENIPVILGDAVHNLRSSLDHLIYRLVSVYTNGLGPFTHLYFPIGADAVSFEDGLKRASECKTKPTGVVQRLGPAAIKAIRSIEPYPGGRGELLWQLHKLDILDKHCLLLTVGACNDRQTMSLGQIANLRYLYSRVLDDIPEANDPVVFMDASEKMHFPLKSGYILGTYPKSQMHEKMQFPVEVAFGEPEVLKGKLVVVTLHSMAQAIRDIFIEFDRAGFLG